VNYSVAKVLGFVVNGTVAFAATSFIVFNSCDAAEAYTWNASHSVNISQLGQETMALSAGEKVSTASDWLLFEELSNEWRRETATTPSVMKMVMSRHYQRIIGMGMAAVPFILRELKTQGNDPEHWFWALEMITRQDPIPESAYGNTVEMARSWLTFAENHPELVAGTRAISQI
jgi:hypothetical protein